MPTSPHYTFTLRVLLCVRCGAPLEVEAAGGTFSCRFCGAPNQLKARAAVASFAPMHFAPRLPEHERLQRLRMQDGQPLLPPATIAHLVSGGSEIPPWKMQETLAVWQSARERADGGAVDGAEELLFLTLLLSNMYSTQGDFLRQRAMVESALEAFRFPRHRAWMLGLLCRGACREMDLVGAESWLAMLDPHSDDLATDSSYRLSRAMVLTCKHQYQEALAMLGGSRGEVPILDAMDSLAAIFRTNALEKVGRLDLAVPMLVSEMRRPGAASSIEKSIQSLAALHLCPQALPQAMAQHSVGAASRAAASASGGIHLVFIPIGVLMFLGGLGMLAVSLLAAIEIIDPSLASMGIGGAILTFTGFTFGAVGFGTRKAAKRAERIRLHGIPATGRVLGMSRTGVRINGVPMMQVDVEVMMADRPPYQAAVKGLMSGAFARLANGGPCKLRVDPQNPREVVLEDA